MNAKRSKALRRLARMATIGKPFGRYVRGRNGVQNDPQSTRGVYLALKAAFACDPAREGILRYGAKIT